MDENFNPQNGDGDDEGHDAHMGTNGSANGAFNGDGVVASSVRPV